MFLLDPKDITLESSNVAASTESEYDYTGSTTYNTDDIVKVSYESDGTTDRRPIKEYKAVSDSIISYPPNNLITDWSDLGATNRWRMFDSFVGTQTENADSIEIKLFANKCSHFALFQLDATEIDWWLHDSGGATVKNGTIDLSLSSPVGSVSYRSDVIQAVGAWVYNGDIEVHIKKTGSTAKCGYCIIGRAETLGETQFGVEPGVLDYSIYTTNDFGYTFLTQGNTSKEHNVNVQLDTERVDRAYKAISGYRATPLVVEMNESTTNYEPLLTFAWWSKASFVLNYGKSNLKLRWKGMI